MADALEAYLDALGEALRFDPPLADRVVEEIGDHLDCALAAELSCADSESDGDADAARARVIARFGAPRRIAGQFVAMALEANADRLWRLAALTAAVSFAAMRLRALHLDPVEAAGDGLAVAALMLDRGAFIAALALGLWGWWLARDARRSWRPDPGGWRRLSVAADTALTLPRLMEATGVFWPAAALTVEIALVLALAIAVSRSREQAAALRRLLF
jgi:hypothetical protein